MLNRTIFAILVATLLTAPGAAQIRAAGLGTSGFGISAGSTAGSVGSRRGGFPGGSAHFHPGRSTDRGAILLGYPGFYSESDYDSGEVSQQPQVIVVQAAAPAPPPTPPAPRESLLIEWQGDRFVRSTASAKASEGAQIAPDYSERSASLLSSTAQASTGLSVPKQNSAVQPPRELPPAVLVFHNGRREEVSEYTIMSGVIYSKADYWTTGSWTRKIQIADLDVPATLKVNQERGLKFVLPASSNEIVTRP
jgi:hypothetical protein